MAWCHVPTAEFPFAQTTEALFRASCREAWSPPHQVMHGALLRLPLAPSYSVWRQMDGAERPAQSNLLQGLKS